MNNGVTRYASQDYVDLQIQTNMSWNKLKDRPFGEEEVEVFPETTIDYSMFDATGMVYSLPGNPIDLIEGEKYTVLYNGKAYESVCHLFNDVAPCLGSTQESYSDNEPYLIADGRPLGLNSTMFMPSELLLGDDSLTEESTWTLGIFKNEIHHLDPKYIKDMYYSEADEEVILAETTFTELVEFSGMQVFSTALLGLEVGETYIVTWNGDTYELVCMNTSDTSAGVKMYMIGDATGTGECPFAIGDLYASDPISMIMPHDQTITSATVSIKKVTEVVHPIKEKYLPEIPTFDLAAMGLPAIPVTNKAYVEADMDTAELISAANKGIICVKLKINIGAEVELVAFGNPINIPSVGAYSVSQTLVYNNQAMLISVGIRTNGVHAMVKYLQVAE